MLLTVREEILRAAKEVKINPIECEPLKTEKIRHDLLIKYGKDQRFEFCCDNISDYAAVQHPEAWAWIHEFLDDNSALLLYDSSIDTKARPDRSMFLVKNGKELVQLLENCYGFDFYLTDDGTDYVLCYNHHDYIIGAGKAKAWVNSLVPRHELWIESLKG